jgi:glycosyltransferase involved in cell wall biosynthesis
MVSVVLPTFNEYENLQGLVQEIVGALGETPLEIVIVDDASPDGTGEIAANLALSDSRVHHVARSGRRGLASAVFEGAKHARGHYVCVMGGDFSHDPEELPGMLAKAQEGYSIVVGSRYVHGSMFVGQPIARRLLNWLLNTIARLVIGVRTRDVLTGFVLCERELITTIPTAYSSGSFTWLMELLATDRQAKVCEWPIVFRDRRHGSSEAGANEVLSFAVLCARLLAGRLRRLG